MNLAEKAVLTPVVEGHLCPITRRVLPRTLLGRSPFQTERWTSGELCSSVEMPRPRYPFGRLEGVPVPELVGEWLRTDPVVDAARRAGAWTDFCDQIAANPADGVVAYKQLLDHEADVPLGEALRIERAASIAANSGVTHGEIQARLDRLRRQGPPK